MEVTKGGEYKNKCINLSESIPGEKWKSRSRIGIEELEGILEVV